MHLSTLIQLNIPKAFICPITMDVMIHPVVTRYGQTFERSAILNWLSQNDVCPLRRKPLRPSDLIADCDLEAKICFWRQSNGVSEPTEEETDANKNLVAFLPSPDNQHSEAMARDDQHRSLPSVQSMLTMSRRRSSQVNAARQAARSQPAPTISVHITKSSRQPKEGRHSLLSQMLASSLADLDELDIKKDLSC
jgi:hypothetical protein